MRGVKLPCERAVKMMQERQIDSDLGHLVYAECLACSWTATATPSSAARQAAVNDIMRAAMDHAWESEGGCVTRVVVDGRERSRHAKTRRRR